MTAQVPDPSANFTLAVKNFGPIARANVDMRPLTVFVGPSNTGKSYLAVLIYALHKCFSQRFPLLTPSIRDTLETSIAASGQTGKGTSIRSVEWLRDLREWLSSTSEDDVTTQRNQRVLSMPQSVAHIIRPIGEETQDLDREVESEITRCFSVADIRSLVRRTGRHEGAKIALKIPQSDDSSFLLNTSSDARTVSYKTDFKHQRSSKFSGCISIDEPITVRAEYLEQLNGHGAIEFLNHIWKDPDLPLGSKQEYINELVYLIDLIIRPLLWSLFHPLNSNSFYLPASRTGVMHSHQTVVSALIQSASTAGRRPTVRVPVLSGVLTDFLDDLITLDSRRMSDHRILAQRRPRKNPLPSERIKGLADLLETNILGGSINFERMETNYPIFSYRPSNWKDEIPLTQSSSMVSELAPVVLYLRYLVRPGDLLIIEEPESHLHPEMQSAFVHELARLVRSGVRVLLTTHSDWVLQQIGNLVMLSELPESKRNNIGGADVALRPEQVGTWLFAPKASPKGTVVTEIELERETGLYPVGYSEVSEALYNDSTEIFNRMQDAT